MEAEKATDSDNSFPVDSTVTGSSGDFDLYKS
jgi:hypothetical protein